MAVPKRKTSKCNKRLRRAHLALSTAQIINCPNCAEKMRPHRVCPNCGFYKGREVVKYEEE